MIKVKFSIVLIQTMSRTIALDWSNSTDPIVHGIYDGDGLYTRVASGNDEMWK